MEKTVGMIEKSHLLPIFLDSHKEANIKTAKA